MADLRICSVDGCGKPRYKREFCNAHYLKLRRHGDPLVGKTRLSGPFRREWLDKHALSWGDKDQCLIFPFSLSPNGYGQATLENGDVTGVHRYVCTAQHGAPPSPDYEAAHSCGNRPCVNRWHIRWATRAENMGDKLLHGTDHRGEKNGHAKLTRPQVDEIIRLRGAETGRSLADRFGVTPAQISNIQLGKQWAYGS